MRPYLLFTRRSSSSSSSLPSLRTTSYRDTLTHNNRRRTIRQFSSPISTFLIHPTSIIDVELQHHSFYLYYYCFAVAAVTTATTLVTTIAFRIFDKDPTNNEETESNEHFDDRRTTDDSKTQTLSTSPSLSNDDTARDEDIDDRNCKLLATSSAVVTTTTTSAITTTTTKEYDFIIVGYGTAGRSAVTTLQQQCPTATIAVIDPFIPSSRPPSPQRPSSNKTNNNHKNQSNSNIHFYPSSRVTEFDPLGKECVVIGSDPRRNSDEYAIKYRHGILIHNF